jgi:phage-related protein
MTTPGEEHVTFSADMRGDLAATALANARALDEMGDEARDAERELSRLNRQAIRTGTTLELAAAKNKILGQSFGSHSEMVGALTSSYKELTKASNKTDDSQKGLQKRIRGTRNEMARLNATAAATAGSTGAFAALQRIFGGMAAAMSGLAGVMKPVGLGFAALGAVIVGGSLLPHLLNMIQGLSSLAALSALAPAGIFSLVASLLTLKMALGGVGDAVSAAMSGDWEKFWESMKKLSPNAQAATYEMAQFADAMKSIKTAVQDAFFAPLVGQIAPTLRTLIPILRTGFAGIASEFGAIAAHFLAFIRSAEGSQMLRTLFANARTLVGAFGRGLLPILQGIARVVQVASPFWDRMTAAMEHALTRFGEWLSRIADSGQLTIWLERAFKVASNLWSILVSVGSLFASLARAVSTGNVAFQGTADVLRQWADWAKSDIGQSKIAAFFAKLKEMAAPFIQIFKNLGQALKSALGAADAESALKKILDFFVKLSASIAKIGPSLGPIAALLAGIFGAKKAGAGEIGGGILDFFGGLGGGGGGEGEGEGGRGRGRGKGKLGGLFGKAAGFGLGGLVLSAGLMALPALLETLAPLLELVANLFGKLMTVATPIIDALFAPLGSLIAQLTPVFAAFFERMKPVIDMLAGAYLRGVQQIGEALKPVIELAVKFSAAFGEKLGDMLIKFAPVLRDWITMFADQLANAIRIATPLIEALYGAMLAVFSAFTEVWTAMLPLVEVFIKFQEVISPIRDILLQLFTADLILRITGVATALVLVAKGMLLVALAAEKMVEKTKGGLFGALFGASGALIGGLLDGSKTKIDDNATSLEDLGATGGSVWDKVKQGADAAAGSTDDATNSTLGMAAALDKVGEAGDKFLSQQDLITKQMKLMADQQKVFGELQTKGFTPETRESVLDLVKQAADFRAAQLKAGVDPAIADQMFTETINKIRAQAGAAGAPQDFLTGLDQIISQAQAEADKRAIKVPVQLEDQTAGGLAAGYISQYSPWARHQPLSLGQRGAIAGPAGPVTLGPREFGGPVVPGGTYLTGEAGSELFLPFNGGSPRVLGRDGAELFNPMDSGYIFPHEYTGSGNLDAALRNVGERFSAATVDRSYRSERSSVTHDNHDESTTVHVHTHYSGGSPDDSKDLVRLVRREVRRVLDAQRERRY